ncbi:MAG TPA: PhoX family phosphatase [Nocardioidaceae bacterium]|nr:PhoX family phosphatase [Nocardioidaceae bacterium]
MTSLLPLLTSGPHGSRSHLTCQFKCGFACDQPVPNTSANEEIGTLVVNALARRSLIKGSAMGAGALVLGGLVSPNVAAAATRSINPLNLGSAGFVPVAPNVRDNVSVPTGYTYDVVAKWGDPIIKGAPAFDVHNQTPEAAAQQFGYNCDYVGLVYRADDRAVMMVDHEYTDENLMFPTGAYDADTIKRIAIQNHGLSIIEVERQSNKGRWRMRDISAAKLNRRITGTSRFELVGPAAGDPRLRTSADPLGRRVLGTLNNCAGGTTPWGTFLSGEENFNQYFDKNGTIDAAYTTSFNRYGLTGSGSRGWSAVDPRFDLVAEPHEAFRFGWVIEIDPLDPESTPRKHTMLGRMKHEGANITIASSGHAVAYMGDDERGDYIYKFVSADLFDPRETQSARRRNMELLTKGTLYVAKFTGDGSEDGVYDGSGIWIPLTTDTESFVPGYSVADVLINTRLAADLVGPTKMDRPEDIEGNPINGKIYCALTNNSNRGNSAMPVNEPNPISSSMTRPQLGAALVTQSGNRNGYILEMTEDGDDHTGTTFTWDLFLVCGDPAAPETYFAGYPKELVSPISCPDNVAFDAAGNLWISTDGAVLGGNDGLYRVPVEGPERGKVECFLTVPFAAECCGPLISQDQKSVFAAMQHPGETTGATFENQTSTWPHTDAFPRPGVIVAYKS